MKANGVSWDGMALVSNEGFSVVAGTALVTTKLFQVLALCLKTTLFECKSTLRAHQTATSTPVG